MKEYKTMLEELQNMDLTFIKDFFKRENEIDEIHNKQIDRFHAKYGNNQNLFGDFMEKVINKYKSKDYKDRYWKLRQEAPEVLFFFVEKVAVRYGNEATKEQYEKESNVFTSSIYFYNGYMFHSMTGQGCFVKITKI